MSMSNTTLYQSNNKYYTHHAGYNLVIHELEIDKNKKTVASSPPEKHNSSSLPFNNSHYGVASHI